jgi:glycosyltransferase involved in cell wall biosynthesis
VITVVICSYSLERWEQLAGSIESVLAQSHRPREVIVVVDHCDELLDRVRAEFPQVRAMPSEGPPGLSGARNTGLLHARAPVVAFLDDDARADPDWLASLAPWYADPDTIGVGGHIEPHWDGPAPGWLPPELNWVVGGTHRGVTTTVAPVRNLFGSNMSYRREALEAVGGFRVEMGRVGGAGMSCEDTEVAIRASMSRPGSVVLHVPAARVEHLVRRDSANWRYLVRRCWREGRSKALLASYVGRDPGLASERRYVARVLPAGVAAGLRDAAHGDPRGLARVAAIGVALTTTALGYAYGAAMGDARRAGT